MNNKWMMAVAIGVVAVLAGLGVLFGINVAVQKAMSPVGGYLEDIVEGQKDIQDKLGEVPAADLKAMASRLEALEAKIKVLEAKLAGRPVRPQPEEPSEDLNKVYDIPVGSSAVLGQADAPVTITVFTDYQCPFCGRFYPAVREAAKAYPDKVKVVIKHFPLSFHPMARPAAKAALAAGVQGKFYEMTDLLLENAAALGEDKFKELAGQAGLNVDQFMKDFKDRDGEWEKKIQEDMALAEQVGVRGTPSYYLNGKVAMARSPQQWKQAIEDVLGEQKAK